MKYTGKIEKDFEEYLIRTKLWKPYHEDSMAWIQKIGDLMDVSAKRTAEENKKLKEEDYIWWVELVKLQEFYGADRDLFGEYIELKGMTSQRNGQFFTPMSICKMMSRMMYTDEMMTKEGIVSDPTSGSGRMMIAHANNAQEMGHNSGACTYYNQDIDYKAFIFTTLNAALRNLCSVNIWGDTLAVKEYKVFITIPTRLGMAAWYERDYEIGKIKDDNERMLSRVAEMVERPFFIA